MSDRPQAELSELQEVIAAASKVVCRHLRARALGYADNEALIDAAIDCISAVGSGDAMRLIFASGVISAARSEAQQQRDSWLRSKSDPLPDHFVRYLSSIEAFDGCAAALRFLSELSCDLASGFDKITSADGRARVRQVDPR